jgi:hypothetical protein
MVIESETKAGFVRVLEGAIRCIPALPECASVPIIAMAALESGWGTTPQAREGCNYWNTTAGKYWTGPTMQGGDTDGAGKPIVQQWRVYDSPVAALEDFLRFLAWPRYAPARDFLMANQPEAFIKWLGPDRLHQDPVVGGWYELPSDLYLSRWQGCRIEVLALTGVDSIERAIKRWV